MFDLTIEQIKSANKKHFGLKKDKKYLSTNRCIKVLTPSEEAWLIKHYKHTKNDDIIQKLSISHSKLHRFARLHGLKKTKQFLHKLQIKQIEHTKEVCERHGIYKQTSEYIKKKWIEIKKMPIEKQPGWKPGRKPWEQKGMTKKKFDMAKKKGGESLSKLYRKERARMYFGLDQKTKLKIRVLTHKMSAYKYTMIHRKNYFAVDGQPTWIAYDAETNRSEICERHAEEIGLLVKQADE